MTDPSLSPDLPKTEGMNKAERKEFNDANRPYARRVEVVASPPTTQDRETKCEHDWQYEGR